MRIVRSLLLVSVVVVALLVACDKSDVRLFSIYLTADKYSLALGDTTQMYVRPYPDDADTGFPDATIVWASSDTSVASVSQDGVLSARRFGITDVSVSYGHFVAHKQMIVSDTLVFDSDAFKNYLLARFDTNADGVLEGYETSQFIGLDLTKLYLLTRDTVSLRGLEFFSSLQTLSICNLILRDLDLSCLPELRELSVENCEIEKIDLSHNPKIESVFCFGNPSLHSVEFGSFQQFGPNALKTFDCHNSDLFSVDLSRAGGTLGDVDVAGNVNLATLDLRVDTLVHSCKVSCDATNVLWPDDFDMTFVYVGCR